ncbi:hypothetical protein SORBI_3009G048300 [Sorghum bicolor]|uniref:Factor of DNA methylation 1-5/IDN2 domain-containing protein n=1 Tax=Sorghum bicolor TaxID=4558 RepID=A0A1Z5R1L7_SORBI|nr:hypothetical protein SORBI_3009G048300 [Sorghum bicolor]
MDYTSDGDSEVEAYGSGTFELLESGDLQVMTDEGLYRCPFCSDEDKDHSLNDLLQHASGVGAAHDRQAKEKADHRALARHLKGKPAESPGARLQPMLIDVQDPEHTQDEQFVWPWMAILVNMPNEFFGKSANRLKEHYSSFHPVKVHPVYSKGRPTRDAVFEFGNDWSAFRNARAFDAHFAMKGYSKNCWKEMKSECKEPVGWMARADDYNSLGAIGELLRKNGDLKTLKDIGSEGANKTEKLLSNLACKVKEKEIYLEQLESEYNKRSASLNIMMQKREQQLQSYNQEILKMRQLGQQNTQRIVEQNRKLRYDMQDMADALDARNKQIEQSEHDKKKLEQEKLKNAMRTNHLRLAALEQEKADENVQKLVDKQTLEKKQKLELEINHLSGKLHVMELKPGDEDPESREKIDKLKEELNEKIDELKYAENYNQDLISRERKSSDELREAREVLINSLQSLPRTTSCQSQIGVKKVGELDPSVFLSLCKRKFPAADAEAKSSSLCSKWQNEIENPEWQPFKVIIVDGKASEALNEGDRKLQELKELGQEPYAAVTKVLMELKDANGGRKDPFPELWNYDQGRKANMVEGARHAVMLWNASKTKKGKKSR